MGTIKVNGNDKELTNLSGKKPAEQTKDKEVPNLEFKVDAELLDTPEVTPIKKIHNLS